jgi:hypothetical protein
VRFEYGLDATYGLQTPDQQVGADHITHTVSFALSGLLPNSQYHVRAVATNSAGSIPGNDLVFTTPADPPPPPPVFAKNVNVQPVSGHVFIKLPPGAVLAAIGPRAWSAVTAVGPTAWAAQSPSPPPKGQGFVPLTEARQIPIGSILDTTAGTVKLTTATARAHQTQFGDFTAGIFELLQKRKQRGLTDLDLVNRQSPRQVCAAAGKAQAARKRLSSTVLGLLKGRAHGRFTTRGTYSSATVRGTIWGVANRCDGTLTRVTRGVVVVRDFRRHRNIIVTSGKTYLARAPGA